MCLGALRDRGSTRINIGIARAHFVSFRWAAVLPLDFKNQQRFLKQKKTKPR